MGRRRAVVLVGLAGSVLVGCAMVAGYDGYSFDRAEEGAAGTGGAGGAAGTGGAAGASGTGGTGGGCTGCGTLEECWNGQLCVAKLVAVTGGYSIDATEVTRSQYEAWLNTGPSTSGQVPACTWNTSYTPSCEWPPGAKGEHPVVCVDWCDAYAYCAAVGKRLCGAIGGGMSGYGEYDNASVSQW